MAAVTEPIAPHLLADHALRLLRHRSRRGRPVTVWVRRATSAAYYAVFHAVAAAVADQLMPRSPAVERRRLARSLDHTKVREVCDWVAGRGDGREHVQPIVRRLREDAALVWLAKTFVRLQSARHAADYDHLAVISRDDAEVHHADAVRALAVLDAVRRTPSGQELLALVALHTPLR